MKKDQKTSAASGGQAPGIRTFTGPSPAEPSPVEPSTREASAGGLSEREVLEAALRVVGLDGDGAVAFCDAALVVGAMTQGRRGTRADLRFTGESARAAEAAGGRPRPDAAPGSMESHLSEADRALTAMEAIASCSMRLEAALVAAAREQTVAVGSALLAEKDVAGPGELSVTARERWRSRSKTRTKEEVAPAIGWTPGETVHLVGLAMAPVAFSMPVVTQMSRGLLPWRLARSLWRACEGLDAADAAHVATVMCGDDAETCVPERLAPDGTVVTGPWEHRAFWTALAREVVKITAADDADPADAEADRAAREAAYVPAGACTAR